MDYELWLYNIEGIGNVTIQKLLTCFGSARQIYQASEQEMSQLSFLSSQQLKKILQWKDQRFLQAQAKLKEKLKKEAISFVTTESCNYPNKLRDIYDLPYGLFYQGSLPMDDRPGAAIVGARRCSAYGRAMAEELAKELSIRGYEIISGMAKGIDTAAHQGALRAGGTTYAVLGCGVDICYPRENIGLYEEIRTCGGILSESAPGTQPLAHLFPARNRMISGLSNLVIVVEAKEKSGSLITSDFALEQGRDIYAVPGRMTDAMSAGCNQLIAQGAGIITSIEGLLNDLQELPVSGKRQEEKKPEKKLSLEKEESLVYSCFDFYPKAIEQVRKETNMELLPLLSVIMKLCSMGLIQESFKNQYIRIR